MAPNRSDLEKASFHLFMVKVKTSVMTGLVQTCACAYIRTTFSKREGGGKRQEEEEKEEEERAGLGAKRERKKEKERGRGRTERQGERERDREINITCMQYYYMRTRIDSHF